MRRCWLVALALALSSACVAGGARDPATGGQGDPTDPSGPVTVASFDFPESRILAEVYAQALESAGYPVERSLDLASREIVEPALETGLVDLVPEYAGTALNFLTRDLEAAKADAAVTHRRLVRAFAARGVRVLDYAPAQNQNGLVVSRATAAEHALEDISDLRVVASRLVIGGPPECRQRTLCLVGLRDVYGLRFKQFVPLDVGGPLTVAALDGGEIDVAVLFTTDPNARRHDFVLLNDDRRLQPAENVTPVIRQAVVDTHGPGLVRRIDAVTRRLTTGAVAELVRGSQVLGQEPSRLAREWLRDQGLL